MLRHCPRCEGVQVRPVWRAIAEQHFAKSRLSQKVSSDVAQGKVNQVKSALIQPLYIYIYIYIYT